MIRAACAGACLILVYLRLIAYEAYRSKALWWGETLLFSSFAAAFLARREALPRKTPWSEIILPAAAAGLPLAMVHWITGITPLRYAWAALPAGVVMGAVAAGHFLATAGVASLRRSFGVTPQARALETGGLYRWVRHPIYLGELIAASAVALLRFCPRNCALLAAFFFLQVWRARAEERVLAAAFPEYGSYRDRTGFFFPKI